MSSLLRDKVLILQIQLHVFVVLFLQFLNGLVEADIEETLLPKNTHVQMEPTTQSLKHELVSFH